MQKILIKRQEALQEIVELWQLKTPVKGFTHIVQTINFKSKMLTSSTLFMLEERALNAFYRLTTANK